MPPLVVLTTAGSPEEADRLARELVGRRLAACVNIVPGVRSIYRWEGEVREDGELLLVIKTRAEELEALRAAVRELHSYDLPEILALPVAGGDRAYLDWIEASVGPQDDAPPSG